MKHKKVLKNKEYTSIEILFLMMFIGYTLLIIVFTCVPGDYLPDNNPPAASLIFHFIEYFILAIFLGIFAFHFTSFRTIRFIFIIGIGLGILTEIIQIFIAGRCFGVEDIFANIAGLNTAIALLFISIEYILSRLIKYPEVF